jgi:hypothetical protein
MNDESTIRLVLLILVSSPRENNKTVMSVIFFGFCNFFGVPTPVETRQEIKFNLPLSQCFVYGNHHELSRKGANENPALRWR